MKKQQTVELNGKVYDATSGEVLRTSHVSAHSKKTGPSHSQTKTGKSKAARSHASATAHAVHKKTERAKTLMRHAVKKPGKVDVKSGQHPVVIVPHAAVDPQRLAHAKKVPRSQRISKFGPVEASIKQTPAILPVQPEPATETDSFTYEAPNLHEAHSFSHPKLHDDKPDFEKALQQATSHTQPRHKKATKHERVARKMQVTPRIASIAAVSMAIVFVAGFFAWQKAPNVSMQLASSRAGVEASLPGYQPAGFDLDGPINYGEGQVTLSYKSRSDDREFKVYQRNSDWSNAELETTVLGASTTQQIVTRDGTTIYINKDDASWLKDGILYQIQGNSSLSPDQILRLAESL